MIFGRQRLGKNRRKAGIVKHTVPAVTGKQAITWTNGNGDLYSVLTKLKREDK
jgi:hypothetical protein